MRYTDFQTHTAGRLDGKLWKNLPAQSLVERCQQSQNHSLRGLVVREDNYYWDAAVAIHGTVAHYLDLDSYRYVDDRFWVMIQDDECRITWTENFLFGSNKNRAYKRLLGSSLIFFDGGSTGWLSGPEMMSELAE